MSDLISRQAAIDALWYEREKLDKFMDECIEKGDSALRAGTKAERNRIEEDIYILKQLPSTQPEQDVLAWLLAYHTKSFELHGRYLPHEVISWLVNDFSKEFITERREDE